MKIKLNESLTNPKEKTAKGLADKINAWYDFDTNYIDDGSQRRTAEKKNENIVAWFSEHPTEIKKEAYTILKSMASKWGGGYSSKVDRIFGKHINENVNEGVTKLTPLNEVTVTRIPNFNLESDAYIVMLYLLKNNSGFKKAATNAGIDLFSGSNTKTVFAGLHNNLKKVITPQIIKSVVQTLNQKRKVLFIDDTDIEKGVHNDRFAGLLALGVIDSFVNDPIDYKLLKDLGNAKLNDLANKFSINRGKMKLGAMMGNTKF